MVSFQPTATTLRSPIVCASVNGTCTVATGLWGVAYHLNESHVGHDLSDSFERRLARLAATGHCKHENQANLAYPEYECPSTRVPLPVNSIIRQSQNSQRQCPGPAPLHLLDDYAKASGRLNRRHYTWSAGKIKAGGMGPPPVDSSTHLAPQGPALNNRDLGAPRR